MYNTLFGKIRKTEAVASKIDEFTFLHDQELLNHFDNAHKTCREWTNSPCQEAAQIIPMLEKYLELKLLKKNKPDCEIPFKYVHGYDNIENYRTKYMNYWSKVTEYPICLPWMYYPGRDEMVDFSTFHWAIHMTYHEIEDIKNNDSRDIHVYKCLLDHLEKPALATKSKYHNEVERIQKYKQIIYNHFQ
jgi:hypothetical protein